MACRMNTHPAHGCDEHVFRVPPRTRHYPMEPAAPSGRWPRGVHVAKFFGPHLTGRPPGPSLSHRRRPLIRGHARTRRCRRPRPLPRCPVPTNQVTTETPRVELRARRGGGPRGRRDTLVALMLVVGCWCGRGDRPRIIKRRHTDSQDDDSPNASPSADRTPDTAATPPTDRSGCRRPSLGG